MQGIQTHCLAGSSFLGLHLAADFPRTVNLGSSGCHGPRAKAKHVRVTQKLKGTSEDLVQKFIKFKFSFKQLNFFYKIGASRNLSGRPWISQSGPIANVNSKAENLNLIML